jgi:hypothetical protein
MRACAAAVLILRDARPPAPICGRACAFAFLRMRTAITYKSYSLFKQPSSFPRRVFAPGFCLLASLTPMKGWRSAERRTDACEASVGPALSGQARHLARRLASPYGGRPPLGARTVAILGAGAALPLTGIRRIGHSELPHPGRSARRGAPASRVDSCEPPPRDATPRSAFRMPPDDAPRRARLGRFLLHVAKCSQQKIQYVATRSFARQAEASAASMAETPST